MRSRIEFERNVLRLSDLADVRGDKGDVEILNAVVLPLRGRVGDSIQYRRVDIEKYLQQRDHGLKGRINFLGSQRVVLVRKGKSLAPEIYTASAKAVLDQQFSQKDSAITTELEGSYLPLMVPMGNLAIRGKSDVGSVRKEMKVWVTIEIDGQDYTSIPVAFKVKWPRLAYVLTRLSDAKSLIAEDMLMKAEINAADITGEPITELEQVKGQRLRHKLEAGAVLRAEDVEPKPLVVIGREVDVMARVGGIVVQTKAVAESDGFMGQTIRARVLKTKEKLFAEVIGESRAIVSANQVHQ